MSDSDEELDIIKLTINYENIQKVVKVSEDNYSENEFKDECYKLFAIDKDKYELKFYVKDEKAKKSKLETEYISDISDKYEKNNNKLILYLETELKKVKEEKKQDILTLLNLLKEKDLFKHLVKRKIYFIRNYFKLKRNLRLKIEIQ